MGVLQRLKDIIISKPPTEQELYNSIKHSFSINNELTYIGNVLQVSAQKNPEAIALIMNNRSISYRELYFRASLFSSYLQEQGVRPRDNVLMLFENSFEFFITYFALLQIGAVCVPLNVFLHERELAFIIEDADPRAFIISSSFKKKIERVKGYLTTKEVPFLVTEEHIDWATPLERSFEKINALFTRYSLKNDEMALLLYTSGTTGVPKGVMLSSRNVLTNAMQCASRLAFHIKGKSPVSETFLCKERFFAALPLFHVFAQNTCIWLPCMVGGSIIIVPRIDRREILESLKQKPTLFFGVPALYGLLCLFKTAPLDSVKFFVSGGDALPDKIRAAFAMIYGRKICVGYGLTEASPVVAVNVENEESALHVAGAPLQGIKVDIRNEEGKSLPTGSIGTLWLHGDNIMIGYFKSPRETAMVLKDGWLNTGDLASFNQENGKLSIIGRSKDLIIHKGFNIYPQEVENILLLHPAIFQAAVVGREDATTGQVPIAFISLKEDRAQRGDVDKMLRDFCNNYLASYKIPRKFICLDDLPLNSTGKVDKKRLQAD